MLEVEVQTGASLPSFSEIIKSASITPYNELGETLSEKIGKHVIKNLKPFRDYIESQGWASILLELALVRDNRLPVINSERVVSEWPNLFVSDIACYANEDDGIKLIRAWNTSIKRLVTPGDADKPGGSIVFYPDTYEKDGICVPFSTVMEIDKNSDEKAIEEST